MPEGLVARDRLPIGQASAGGRKVITAPDASPVLAIDEQSPEWGRWMTYGEGDLAEVTFTSATSGATLTAVKAEGGWMLTYECPEGTTSFYGALFQCPAMPNGRSGAGYVFHQEVKRVRAVEKMMAADTWLYEPGPQDIPDEEFVEVVEG